MSAYRPPASCQIPNLSGIFEAAFGYRTDGSFVEAGAFDGQTCSNTSCLADVGWRGVYIEPVPAYAAACRRRHRANPGISVLECAVGDSDQALRLSVGSVLTTADPLMVEAYGRIDWARNFHRGEYILAAQRTLDSILREQNVPPGFELLVIDVEGAEEKVLASFDLALWRPQMMIVELTDSHPSFAGFPAIVERDKRIREGIAAQGYGEIFHDTINTVFWAAGGRPLHG